MKVWERINEIKGTTEPKDGILNWMIMNRVCPLMISDGLEEDEQLDLQDTAERLCQTRMRGECYADCYRVFLEMEVDANA